MRIGWAVSIVVTLAAQAVGAAAQEPPKPLMPSSKWQIDYASGDCRLIRSFGEGKDLVTLQFARANDVDEIEMALGGRGMPTTREEVPVSVGTSTVAQVHGMHAQGVAMEDRLLGSIRFHPDVDLPKALRSDASQGKPTVLSVAFVRGYRVAFDLGPMKAPLAALDACADDLVRGWAWISSKCGGSGLPRSRQTIRPTGSNRRIFPRSRIDEVPGASSRSIWSSASMAR